MTARLRDRPLNLHLRPTSPDQLADVGLPAERRRETRRAMEAIYLDAMLEAAAEGRWLSFSRRCGFYSRRARYDGPGFGYKPVMRAVDALLRAGLIEEDRARAGRSTGKQSRLRATAAMIGQLPDFILDPVELVRLKHGGNLVPYSDNDFTRGVRRNCLTINEATLAAHLDIEIPNAVRNGPLLRAGALVVRFPMVSMWRVFNDGWAFGGRFYGPWWQNVPKRHRPSITINGEPTVEPDYPQLHARLLYGMMGKPLVGDAYATDDWSRGAGKVTFNVLVNAKNERAAIGAMQRHLGGDRRTAAKIIDAVKRRHGSVESAFHCDLGRVLQRVDSDMAEEITLDMLAKGVVVLSIHDSFVTPERHRGLLDEAMDRAFTGAVRRCQLTL